MKTLDMIKSFGMALVNNLIAILFLLGMVGINTGIYIGFGLVPGLIASGISLIIIAIILAIEKPPIEN